MRILIVSVRGPTNLDRRGGAQDYMQFVSSPWQQQGHRVTILCAQQRVDGELLPATETVDGVRVERVGDGKSRFTPLMSAARLAAVDNDVVLENMMGFPLFLPLFVRRTSLVALKHHFEGVAFIHSQGVIKGLFGMFLENLLQPLIYRRTPFVVVSELTRGVLFSRWLKPAADVSVVPPGVWPIMPPAGRRRSQYPTVVYYGALDTSRKRVDHLIDAFRIVADLCPRAKLVIAGKGPDEDRLKAQSEGLSIEFRGYLTEVEKADLLAEAWVFASPSMSEGFGITWVEANSAGLPVVAYDLGLDTVNNSCSIMLRIGDINGLADALVRLFSDERLRSSMSAAAKRNASRFDWMRSSSLLLNFLERVVR